MTDKCRKASAAARKTSHDKPCIACGSDWLKHKIYKVKGKKKISGKCVLCFDEDKRETARKKYWSDPEKHREFARKWSKENRKTRNKGHKRYYYKYQYEIARRRKIRREQLSEVM